MKNLNWKNVLIIWIAVGLLSIGLFHIFAHSSYQSGNGFRGIVKNYLGRDLSFLITIVGAFLIWGLKIRKKGSKKDYS